MASDPLIGKKQKETSMEASAANLKQIEEANKELELQTPKNLNRKDPIDK